MNNEQEIWVPVYGYEDLYEVSSFGNVKRKNGELLGQRENGRGYNSVCLCRESKAKSYTVHRLVALSFVPRLPGQNVVRHKDNNPFNNKCDNLMWGDYKDNSDDQKRAKTSNSGERNYNTELTEADVIEMHALHKEGKTYEELALEYDLNPKRVGEILNFKGWSYLKSQLAEDENLFLKKKQPFLIKGDNYIDHRGTLSFCNDMCFNGIKRMYVIEHDKDHQIRAWHAHEKEGKFMYVCYGTFQIGTAPLIKYGDKFDLDKPTVKDFVISSIKPSILWIPPGYANGLMNLTTEAKVVVWSTSTIEESRGDDIRFDYNYVDIWNPKYY